MSTKIVLQGTLNPDGTLDLDHSPDLTPGRVLVTVEPAAQAVGQGDFWQRMEAIWANQKSRGHVPRTIATVEATRAVLDRAMQEEFAEANRLQAECRTPLNQESPE